MSMLTNYLKATPALCYERDGSRSLVSVFVKESSGNYYVFDWPHRSRDIGRSVSPKYLQYVRGIGCLYVWIAAKMQTKFPKWVKI